MAMQEAIVEATAPPNVRRLPPISRRIKTLIANKRKTRIEWQRTREPATKTKLNSMVEHIRLELESAVADTWEARINEASE